MAFFSALPHGVTNASMLTNKFLSSNVEKDEQTRKPKTHIDLRFVFVRRKQEQLTRVPLRVSHENSQHFFERHYVDRYFIISIMCNM